MVGNSDRCSCWPQWLGYSILAINTSKGNLLPGYRVSPAVEPVSFAIGKVSRQISVVTEQAFFAMSQSLQ